MKNETITIHSMKLSGGQCIEYARIFRKSGMTMTGQSLMLHRLSAEQVLIARRVGSPAPRT